LNAAAIIPAYREEKHVGDVVRRTRHRIDHVLVVDDGSSDQSAQQARDAGAEVIVHSQNRGKGEAIKTGLRHWLDRQITHVIVLDADGQHLPEEIDRFIAAAASTAGPSFFLGSKRISGFCGQKIPDTQCGFRMLDRQLIPELLGGANRFDYETEMLIIASRKGYRIESVPITTVYSDEVSKIQPMRDALRFFKLMRRYRKL